MARRSTLNANATDFVSGRKVVASAGTAEKLDASATPALFIDIVAETDNTGIIVVGDSAVVASQATRKGVPLSAGDVLSLRNVELSDVWLDSTVSGDGASYAYTTVT